MRETQDTSRMEIVMVKQEEKVDKRIISIKQEIGKKRTWIEAEKSQTKPNQS